MDALALASAASDAALLVSASSPVWLWCSPLSPALATSPSFLTLPLPFALALVRAPAPAPALAPALPLPLFVAYALLPLLWSSALAPSLSLGCSMTNSPPTSLSSRSGHG